MKANLIGISRHRLGVDGTGVTTLVAFHGCTLDCKYCLNPICKDPKKVWKQYTPEQLYNEVEKDNLYFLATGGGVTFGGGEPLMKVDFIKEFHKLCETDWKINVETALNVPQDNVYRLLPVVNQWIVDIKDMNDEIYQVYTGKSNDQVMSNLSLLATFSKNHEHCKIKIKAPHIPDFNTDEDVQSSINQLRELGFTDIEEFTYIIR